MINNFYTESPLWHEKIGGIHALLERVKISEEQSGDVLRLRKLNRIMSIHASTAIDGVDCKPFVDFMLVAIENSLYRYVDIATEIKTGVSDVPVNVHVNISATLRRILSILGENPQATAKQMANEIGITDKTIKRGLKSLKEAGLIQRVGSDKSGHWEIST